MKIGLSKLLLFVALWAFESAQANSFFAFSFGFKGLPVEERVDFLYSTGYDGIAMNVWNDKLLRDFAEVMAMPVVQSGKFHVFAVYFPFSLNNPKHRSLASSILRIGKPQHVPIWLMIKPVDAERQKVIDLIVDICDEAQSFDTKVILYPHDMSYFESAEDTLPVLEALNKKNLFTSIHSNHELRKGNANRLEAAIKKSAPYLALAALSGANGGDKINRYSKDWSDVVQPLADSTFDVHRYYKLLLKYGYTGPVGLQNFGIPGDPKVHHRESLKVWRSWNEKN